MNNTQSLKSPLRIFLFALSRWLPFPLPDSDQPHHSSHLVFLPCFILSDLKEQRVIVQLSGAQTHSPAAKPPVTRTPLGMSDAVHPWVWVMALPSWEQNIKCQYGMEHQAGLPLAVSFPTTALVCGRMRSIMHYVLSQSFNDEWHLIRKRSQTNKGFDNRYSNKFLTWRCCCLGVHTALLFISVFLCWTFWSGKVLLC